MTDDNFEKNCDTLENYLLQSCKVCNHKKGQRFSEDSTCDCRNKFCCGVRLIYGCVPIDLIITAYAVKPAYDKEALKYFAENPKEVYERGLSLYLHGDLGVGKTLCSVLLAINFVNAFSEGGKCGYKHRVNIRFMEAFNFIDRSRMLQSSNEELSKFKESLNATLFILDDFSNEYKSANNPQYVNSLFENFLRNRISNLLPTIVTTNVPPENIGKEYDARIASLFGFNKDEGTLQGRFLGVAFENPDFRKISRDVAWSKFRSRND